MIHITWKNREVTELRDNKQGRNEGFVAGPARTDRGAAGEHRGQLAQPEGWHEGNTQPWHRESQGMATPHTGQPHASFQNKSSSVCKCIRVCVVSRKQLIHLLFHLRVWMMRK